MRPTSGPVRPEGSECERDVARERQSKREREILIEMVQKNSVEQYMTDIYLASFSSFSHTGALMFSQDPIFEESRYTLINFGNTL